MESGTPYVPVGTSAAEAIARNPEKSDRALAAQLGGYQQRRATLQLTKSLMRSVMPTEYRTIWSKRR
jgi:hypothetical protein